MSIKNKLSTVAIALSAATVPAFADTMPKEYACAATAVHTVAAGYSVEFPKVGVEISPGEYGVYGILSSPAGDQRNLSVTFPVPKDNGIPDHNQDITFSSSEEGIAHVEISGTGHLSATFPDHIDPVKKAATYTYLPEIPSSYSAGAFILDATMMRNDFNACMSDPADEGFFKVESGMPLTSDGQSFTF